MSNSNKKFDRLSTILLNFYTSATLISLKEVGTYLEKVNLPVHLVFVPLLVFFQFVLSLSLLSFPFSRLFDSNAFSPSRSFDRVYPLLREFSEKQERFVFVLYFFALVSRNRERSSREIELTISEEIVQATVKNRFEILSSSISSSLIFKIFVRFGGSFNVIYCLEFIINT